MLQDIIEQIPYIWRKSQQNEGFATGKKKKEQSQPIEGKQIQDWPRLL